VGVPLATARVPRGCIPNSVIPAPEITRTFLNSSE
jgi:hypothetical protein